jgi:flagellar P-ring protein precursor FlgI
MNRAQLILFPMLFIAAGLSHAADGDGVRLKELARVQGVRDNALVGYGLVVGLAGSGDSDRNRETVQSLQNTLAGFGVNVVAGDIESHNVAAVIVTATLRPFAQQGDKLDVQVSSIGDATSLMGGTLLLTALYGPDQKLYALAQGSLSVGGYEYDSFGNLVQKNHPTVGLVPNGGSIERSAPQALPASSADIPVLLTEPDFVTASRVVLALQQSIPEAKVSAVDAGKVVVHMPQATDLVPLIARIENTLVVPDEPARVVVNERTGTVVAGGDVRIGDVSISQGDLRVVISTKYEVSQPFFIGRASDQVQTTVVPNTNINVTDKDASLVKLPGGTTVAELVTALRQIKLTTRDVITILQAIKSAGALHGDLVIT